MEEELVCQYATRNAASRTYVSGVSSPDVAKSTKA
jgi:hypothetical protein